MGFLRIGRIGPEGPTGRSLIGATFTGGGIFKNLILNSSDLFTGTSSYAYPADLNANGYPKNSASMTGTITRSITLPSNLQQSDVMVFRWTGTIANASGAIRIDRGPPGFTVTSDPGSVVIGGTGNNINLSGTNGRIEFQFATSVPTSTSVAFTSSSTFTNLSDIILCKKTDEAAILAATTPEEMFDDNYVAKFVALNAKVFRPMGWANTNFSNVSQSRYLPAWQTCLDLTTTRWEPGAWAGDTSGTDAYTCSSQPDATGAYVHGEMIHVRFVNASTVPGFGALTINSGTRGVVPIFNSGGSRLGAVSANEMGTLTYNSILGGFCYQFGGQNSSMPYELQIAFANRINAHCWLNFPAYFDDTSVSAIAALTRANLKSSLSAYFEYGNEIWNFGFPATTWAVNVGAALGFPSGDNRRMFGWYGLRSREMMGLVTTAWSPRSSSQLNRVLAFQAFGDVAGTKSYRLEGADLASVANGGQGNSTFVTYTGGANYRTSSQRPIDFCESLSYATYYSGAQCVPFDATYVSNGASAIAGLLTAADDYAAGGAGIPTALAFLDNDIRAGTLSGSGAAGDQTLLSLFSGAGGAGIYPSWNAVAVTYSKTVDLYEGGHESWYPSTDTCTTLGISTSYGGSAGKIANLVSAYKHTSAFQTLVADQITQFNASSKSTTWAWLILNGSTQWSTMQDDLYTATFKSWDAQVAYNH